ncbi:MAG: hypothetical protein JNG86_18895 [Verrucomicrobiaceae bacterium]|nr:hypothetical protein [Verrucomicrobiaceae bacterium]
MSNGKLHTCGANQEHVVLAPHDILREMCSVGVKVELVSLHQPVHLTLPGGMKIQSIEDVSPVSADVFIHMFRDPTEPEVLEKLQEWNLPSRLTLKDAFKLHECSKWKYLPLLHKHGLGSEVATPPSSVQWETQTYSTRISTDYQWVETAAFNNNRGQYAKRKSQERIVTRFADNASKGIRSFFRAGYVLGRFTTGWLYVVPAEQRIIKSGTAAHSVPFDLPCRHHGRLKQVFDELSVDYCHFEGCFSGDRMFVFDINPHPTACGSTLSYITKDMAALMIERLEELFSHSRL